MRWLRSSGIGVPAYLPPSAQAAGYVFRGRRATRRLTRLAKIRVGPLCLSRSCRKTCAKTWNWFICARLCLITIRYCDKCALNAFCQSVSGWPAPRLVWQVAGVRRPVPVRLHWVEGLDALVDLV